MWGGCWVSWRCPLKLSSSILCLGIWLALLAHLRYFGEFISWFSCARCFRSWTLWKTFPRLCLLIFFISCLCLSRISILRWCLVPTRNRPHRPSEQMFDSYWCGWGWKSMSWDYAHSFRFTCPSWAGHNVISYSWGPSWHRSMISSAWSHYGCRWVIIWVCFPSGTCWSTPSRGWLSCRCSGTRNH